VDFTATFLESGKETVAEFSYIFLELCRDPEVDFTSIFPGSGKEKVVDFSSIFLHFP
jgi:hypothetical protein